MEYYIGNEKIKLTKNQVKELTKWKENKAMKKLEKYFTDIALGKKEDKANYDF